MPVERILITVKTYPTLSNKYGETVCTAGLREDGNWIRIYPVPFRRIDDLKRYKKYEWIECDLISNAQNKLDAMRSQLMQPDLFEDNEWRKTFKVVRKLPYKFSYRFLDELDKEHTMQILDWEIGALFWKYSNEQIAIEKIRETYLNRFLKTDLHLFLGTTQRWHSSAPNPWVIVGVAPFPFVGPNASKQLELGI
ncbi:MAG: hypothetical protein PHO37_11490 [Kiritimatiellae bacterium]|nr:hypothetical protein [Kiritimatiellia bacterium]